MCIQDTITSHLGLFDVPARVPERGRMYLVRQTIGCPCRLDLVGLDSPVLRPEFRATATVRCNRCWQEFPAEGPVGWRALDFAKIVGGDVQKEMKTEKNLPACIT